MNSEQIKRLMEDKRLQLEARDRKLLHQAKQNRNRWSNQKHSQVYPKPKRQGENVDGPTASNFFSTWETMYHRRMKRGWTPLTIPESLVDTGIKILEHAIGGLLSKLLK